MCGIAGIVDLGTGRRVDPLTLGNMTRRLARRGPDGEGYMLTNDTAGVDFLVGGGPGILATVVNHHQNIGLGHRRLATTDLHPNASQPMRDATGRYWIVFNGQIYNHLQLRRELETFGYKFCTHHSDTEVILNAYALWGERCVERMSGMWAFFIWDTVENRMFMSRDRVGKQPLFYMILNGLFYFASELTALLEVKELQRELDELSVYDYLTYANVPAPKTMFRDVYKLPASYYITFVPGEEMRQQRYWDPVSVIRRSTLPENEIVKAIREKMFEAVRVRMQSDVNVGMLLSGGLDSSINLACMSQFSSEPVRTYTVGFENKNLYTNEFSYARKVASFFKAEYNELLVTEAQFLDTLPEVMYLQDEPIADTANIPLYLISKLAGNDGIKILLSGEGSDEIFIGYQHWRLIYQYEKIFRNRPLMAGMFNFLHQKSVFRNRRPYYSNWSYKVKNSWPVFWGGTELRTEEEKRGILDRRFLEKVGIYNSFVPKSKLYNDYLRAKPYDTFEWMGINDLLNRLPDQLLARLDRMTMAASVEGRNPFLDINLIEFMLSVPSHLKTKNSTEKYLLKRAFSKLLPDDIIRRSKDSFTVPLNHLFRHGNSKQEYLSFIHSFNRDARIFSDAFIKRLSQAKHVNEFWTTLNFALWYRAHK